MVAFIDPGVLNASISRSIFPVPFCQIKRSTGTSIGCGFKLPRIWYGISHQHNNVPGLVSNPSPVRGMCDPTYIDTVLGVVKRKEY